MLTMFWRWLFCLLEACVEKCKDCTRLYSLKYKCPKNILPEFCFDSLNGYHEWIFRRNMIELDLNKHLRFFCCSVYIVIGLTKWHKLAYSTKFPFCRNLRRLKLFSFWNKFLHQKLISLNCCHLWPLYNFWIMEIIYRWKQYAWCLCH